MIALFEKIDTSRILKRHFRTLGDIVGKNKIWDVILFYVVPIVFGAAYYGYGKDCVTKECWDNLLIVNSIFLPLMLTALISLYSMKDRFAGDKISANLLGQVAANTFTVSCFRFAQLCCHLSLILGSGMGGQLQLQFLSYGVFIVC